MRNEFVEAYEAVFGEDRQIKTCSFRAHAKLIEESQKLEPNTDFGDKYTGRICMSSIAKMHLLYMSVKNE